MAVDAQYEPAQLARVIVHLADKLVDHFNPLAEDVADCVEWARGVVHNPDAEVLERIRTILQNISEARWARGEEEEEDELWQALDDIDNLIVRAGTS